MEVALVMKVKLGHLLRMRYCSKVLARTLSLRVSWVPKAKVGHCVALARNFELRQLSRGFLST